MKHVSWVYDKRSGNHILNFNYIEDRLYYDWFIKIRDGRLVAEANKDTIGDDYETGS